MTTYPSARRDDVTDLYHGTPIADPYRWLEDPHSDETAAFVAAQNALSQAYLAAIPERPRFHQRLTELWNFPRFGAPIHRGGLYFYAYNDGLQNQPVLMVATDLAAAGRVLLDPNTLSDDGTVAVTTLAPSRDGRLLAYGLSVSGSDWQEIAVRDVATGQDTGDLIRWCKFSSVAWLPDGTGFYYARYPSPAELADGPLAGEPAGTHQRVYYHRLGDDQAADTLIYARPDSRDLGFHPEVTPDGRYLVLTVWQGTDHRNRIFYRRLNAAAPGANDDFIRLLDEMDARYDFLGNDGATFTFLTDHRAPNGRVIAIDLADPAPDRWREIVGEQDGALDFGRLSGDGLILVRLDNARHRVERRALTGELLGDIPLPDLGQVLELQAEQDDPECYLLFTSFLYPPTVIGHDARTGATAVVWQPQVAFNAAEFETSQIVATSRDGTRVPIFVVKRRGLSLDGGRPTILYGYGGFNLNQLPLFTPARVLWLEQGGVFALATLRGGQEFGETWHAAGMLGNKQNVFDDFIAAAEHLIANGYTNSDHLAIEGRSNGGLLTAACLLQRPDLYGAVHSAVPVIDMLRYHRFTAGRYWTPEYGNAEENAEHFAFLHAYSPLHNVRPGVAYPPLIITTADTDDRVVPMHSLKFAATLQAAAGYAFDPTRPILLRVETRAGHGLGKPTAKLIEEAADVYAFLWANVGE